LEQAQPFRKRSHHRARSAWSHANAITALALACCMAGLAGSEPARAQAYPDRPIKLIVPFSPGGPPDVAARLIGDWITSRLGQIVVENRPGAGGTIAAKAITSAAPDGYTLMLATSGSLAISSQLYKTAGYDPRTAFAAISLVSSTPQVLAVNPGLPVHSVAELVAYAKAHPGKLNYGASTGTPPHLHGEMFKVLTGTDIVFVPYRSATKATTDVLAGQLQLTFEGVTGIMPFLVGGKVRPLAVSSPKRLAELPDLPTMIESGLNGMPPDAWQGVVAPIGTPAKIVETLNAVINEGLRSPDLKAKIARLGGEPRPLTPQEFSAFIAAELERWGKVIKATGVSVD
jgi:tripartite-type tricarboxylate transporter receptor subunit TctC